MKSKIIQIVISCFVAFFGFLGLSRGLEAASPSYQPAPLRNQALMFEMSGSGSQQIKLDVIIKKAPVVKKQLLAKKQLPAKKLFVKKQLPAKQLFVKKQLPAKQQLFVKQQHLVKKQPALAKQAELPRLVTVTKFGK